MFHVTNHVSLEVKHAKYSNFCIIKTTEAIPTKFCILGLSSRDVDRHGRGGLVLKTES